MLIFGSRTSSLLSILALCLTSQQVMGDACTICFDGSDPVGIEDLFVPGEDGVPIPCINFSAIIPLVTEGSKECIDYQLGASAFCGCPPHPDACSLCPRNGTPLNPDATIPDPESGTIYQCSELQFLAPSFPASDPDCEQVKLAGEFICGCPPPCPVCASGTPSTPDAVVTLPNGDVSTCAELSTILSTADVSDQECANILAITTDACGCPRVESLCPLCGEGDPFPNYPDRILPPDPATGVQLSCKDAHALSASVPNEMCPTFQNFAGQICGCPKDTDSPTVSPSTVAPTTQAPTSTPSTSGSESMMITAGKSVLNFAALFLTGGLYFW
jgi:hypothetical protein